MLTCSVWNRARCTAPTRKVGELRGLSHHTLRAWYRDSATVGDRAELSGGESMEEEFERLRRGNRELERANGIL